MIRRILCIVSGILFFVLALYFSYLRFVSPSDTTIRHTLGLYKPQVVGFLPYWLYGKGKDTYRDDVTTLTYFGLALSPDGTIRKEDAPTEGEPGWTLLQNAKFQAHLKDYASHGVTLSLLVQNMVEDEILTLLENPEVSARTMISDVEPIMKANKFTDLNLDIESFTVASDSTRAKYVAFVQEVKSQLTEKNLGTLTVELTPKSPILSHFLDVEKIGRIADFVILMAYDYHYAYSDVAGPVAPLRGTPEDAEYDVTTAVTETLKKIPNEKVILGIPLYGYEWETIRETSQTPVIPGSWQTATHSRLVALLKECDGISSEPDASPSSEVISDELPFDPSSCVKGFDQISASPYLTFAGETEGHFHQIWYEDRASLKEKLILAKKQSLSGVAFWALGYDGEGLLADVSDYRKGSLFRGNGAKEESSIFTLTPPLKGLTAAIASSTGLLKVMRFGKDTYSDETGILPLRMGEAIYADATSSAELSIDSVASFSLLPGGDIYYVNGIPGNVYVRHRGGEVTYETRSSPIFIRVLHALFEIAPDSQLNVTLDESSAVAVMEKGNGVVSWINADNITTTEDILETDRVTIDGESKILRIR